MKHILKHGVLRRAIPIPWVHIPLAIQHVISVWKDAQNSAEQTGIHLGDILKEIHDKEVILYGHSLGAKVIYHTLVQISHQKPKINRTIVKEVHLLAWWCRE
jgi:alpha-beta hydrolase superfamily lysophospholipase